MRRLKELEGEDKKRKIFYSRNSIGRVEHKINFNWIIGSKSQTAEGLATPSTAEKPNSSVTGLVPGKEAEYPFRVHILLQLSKEVAKGQQGAVHLKYLYKTYA